MMFATRCEPYVVNPVLEKAMDRIFILHADHEQNASTSTVRTAASSGANPFWQHRCRYRLFGDLLTVAPAKPASICWKKSVRLIVFLNLSHVQKIKTIPFRLMGFGHRVYKNYDPRAKVMRQTCHSITRSED